MDLSLQGSQINLIARQPQKPKHFLSQTNLQINRPRSASFFCKRSRSSPFLGRPQSADPKFGRSTSVGQSGHFCRESGEEYQRAKLHKKDQKRYESVSSSDLLKLLLDEPIKRSWLCRRGAAADGASSPDEQPSELSSCSRRFSSSSSLNRRTTPTYTVGRSSAEGDSNLGSQPGPSSAQYGCKPSITASRMSSANTTTTVMSNLTIEKTTYPTATKPTPADFWHIVHSSKSGKPDLPGRVSFSSKSNLLQDVDSSDCDNDKQDPYPLYHGSSIQRNQSISAPGPVNTIDFGKEVKRVLDGNYETSNEISPAVAALKKSVRFGAAGDASEEVLAETYEYPKCPSENCSCSTRSSSTASVHDASFDAKCACDSPTCKYTPESGKSKLLDMPSPKKETMSHTRGAAPSVEYLKVIREYKNAVGEELANSVVKNLLEEATSTSKSTSNTGTLNNNKELSMYLGKYATETLLDKQNNLSEVTNAKNQLLSKTNSKRNLVNELMKTDNNFEPAIVGKSAYSSSTESVINNYLKVSASTTHTTTTNKKKQNKPNSADSVRSNKKTKPLVAKTKTPISAESSGKKTTSATSFGHLRQESKLNEFDLDKVDSWMSIHEQAMSRKIQLKSIPTFEDDLERFTKDSNDDDGEEEEEAAESSSQHSSKSDDNSQDDSTYDEIVSVIKEIDDDKKKDNMAEQTSAGMELQLEDTERDSAPDDSQKNRRVEPQRSPDKYKDILNYLDNVEDSCDKTLLETRRSIPESNRSEIEFVVEPDIAEDVPKLSDLLMLPNHQLARRVVALSLRANELANAVHLSKEHIMKIRTEKQKSIRTEKSNAACRMREQKKHYENVVTRHQGFIEQLLKDKGSLCEKVAALTRRLESQNQAWEHKLDTEVQRVKETTLAGEKIRRERWVRENTKKIKELTVKGLETEINKMNCNHQSEITELKRAHQQTLLDAVEEARLKHEQIENGIRESCAQDREAIIEKERMAIRDRFERQLDEERKSFDEQKQKLCEEFAGERERLQVELKEKEIEYQTKRQDMQREKEHELEQTVLELQEKMSKQDEKYQNRINTIEKQYEADFEIWKKEYENTCKMQQVEKENIIRQHYRAERDHQIDAIVTRMDAEALKNGEEFEMKINRLKEKYDKDLLEVECVEKSLRDKYTETRNRLAESDAQVRNYQAEIKQLQIELGHSKKMCSDFLAERDQLRDNLRNEIQNEVTTLKSERDNEIQRIHKRVQQAIEKKDTTIDLLQKENGALRERCIKLEAIIRQQRKDYCVK